MTATLSTTTSTTFYLKFSYVDADVDVDVEFDGRKSNNRKYPRKVDAVLKGSREEEKKRMSCNRDRD